MEITLTRFVHALRSADVPVSPAETLDAFEVLERIGVGDPRLLENALALVLAKSREEKNQFAACFERFFHQLAFEQPAKKTLLADLDSATLLKELEGHVSTELQEVIIAIVSGERSKLTWRVQTEAARLEIDQIRSLREKSHFVDALGAALGVGELESLLGNPARQLDGGVERVLRYLRQYLEQQVRAYVDVQYQLEVDATGKRAVIDAALASHLDQLSPEYYAEVDRVVAKLADRLAQQHRRRRKRAERGVLDIKRTIRDNVAYDGNLFRLHWRRKRLERSAVYVVCDVSNSVSRIARFLLLFLHGLTDVLPEVRAFAFSNRLGEVTDEFRAQTVERAVEEAMFDWGKGVTDYGRALIDLRALVHQELDHRSTIIVLGDARGNYFDPRVDVFASLARRVKQVFWLNPESRDRWSEGDSDMRRYAPHCLRVDVCRDLRDIERFADRLLTATSQ